MKTDKQRIEELERRVKELEMRPPIYMPMPYPVPQPYPVYPAPYQPPYYVPYMPHPTWVGTPAWGAAGTAIGAPSGFASAGAITAQ